MKIKIYQQIIILTIILFLITACEPTSTFDNNYNIGKKGLTMEFVMNSPPREVNENQEFSINVMLKNEGFADVTNFWHKLNYEKLYFTYLTLENPFENLKEKIIKGKNTYNFQGDQFNIIYKLKSNPLKGQLQNPSTTITATVCYSYKTFLTEEICVERDPLDTDLGAKPCKTTSERYLQGQGAPITITNIEADYFLEGEGIVKPYFKIYFKNLGRGIVVKEDKIRGVCDPTLNDEPSIEEWNIIEVSAKLSGEDLDCGNGIVRINSNSPYIICKAKEPENFGRGGRSYVRILSVEANYGYFDKISQEIKILRN